jgi:DNA-directed RNA polymerase subunit RPC12/RpoP
MTQETSGPKLSADRVIYLYRRQVNFAVLWNIVSSLAGLGLAILFWFLLETLWLRLALAAIAILGSGVAQRKVALRVKCPACGGRPLGHINSIFQTRSVRACPDCGTKLRG